MSQKPFLYGAGGIILGFIGGIAVGGATSESKINDALSRAMAPGQSAAEQAASSQQESLAALSERLTALEAAMPDAAALSEQISGAVDERLAGLGSDLSAAISKGAEDQKAALDEAMTRISSGLEQSAQAAAAAVASAATGKEADAGGVSVSEPLQVGQTAVFAEGKVRAFVSRLDPQGGSVRLMVNGKSVALGAGGSAPVSFDDKACSIVVMGLSDGATLGSDCDAATPTSEMARAGGDADSPPPAPEDGFRPGQVAMLGDGALRVFVSGLAEDGTAARIAVNGVSTQVVASGESVEVTSGDKTCTVSVTGVGGGMVGLEGSCG
ncbi:hypothetical protein [Salipiger sp.]|uniref:hypothetical protein n=1 Tax=Salipiger sp. TaxID=2078585 RepID=UPI003A983C20